MYLYTPNKQLLAVYLETKKIPYTGTYMLVSSWLHSSDHSYVATFDRYWTKTKFFSEQKVSMIPVNGTLYPVECFEETEV